MRTSIGITLASAALTLAGSSAFAADRPAPAYFLDTVMAVSTAQQLALSCPSISVNVVVISNASGKVMSQLDTDGFDTSSETLGMLDTSDAFAARQAAFMARHDLEGANGDAVCAAARREITEKTVIGTYLMEVAQ